MHREVPRRWLPDAVFGRREAAPHVVEKDLEGVPVDVALQRVVGRVVRREEEPPRHLGRAEAREEPAAARHEEAGEEDEGGGDGAMPTSSTAGPVCGGQAAAPCIR